MPLSRKTRASLLRLIDETNNPRGAALIAAALAAGPKFSATETKAAEEFLESRGVNAHVISRMANYQISAMGLGQRSLNLFFKTYSNDPSMLLGLALCGYWPISFPGKRKTQDVYRDNYLQAHRVASEFMVAA